MQDIEQVRQDVDMAKAEDLPDTLAEFVTNERKKQNLSLRGCAALIGISHTELSRIERGLRACPSLVTL